MFSLFFPQILNVALFFSLNFDYDLNQIFMLKGQRCVKLLVFFILMCKTFFHQDKNKIKQAQLKKKSYVHKTNEWT